MRLDVIIPTYNRQDLLKSALESLIVSAATPELDVRITVVDNNSKDQTRQVVEGYAKRFGGRLSYIFEGKQGRSFALNTGIRATDGDLVGMIDDDEEVDSLWCARVYSAFREGGVDFVGGPYKPKWGAEPPEWLPRNYPGVIGWIDGGDKVAAYGKDFPGMLMGGNAVLTRAILDKVGLYATSLGRTGERLLAGEDEDMYQRLLGAGARGLYLPDLIIHHHISPERLTKRYFRRWCFWRGVSRGVRDRQTRSSAVYLIGVPRWLYGRAARGLLRKAKVIERKTPDQSFSDELAVWDLAGFFYGKHFYRPAG